MLTEEALILLATLGASGLLVLGAVELAWPSTPRRPARRARVAPPAFYEPPVIAPRAVVEPPPVVEAVEVVVADAPAIEPPPPPAPTVVVPPPPLRRAGRPGRAARDWRRGSSPVPPVPAVDLDPPSPVMSEIAASVIGEPAPVADAPEPRPQVLPIDTCLAMYQDGRFSEVVSLGSAALEVHARMAVVSDRTHEAAALLDLVGLSKLALGDRDGARTAFCAAIRDAELSARSTSIEHLVALVQSVASSAGDATDGETDAVRLRELRACLVALEDALAAAPGDEGLVTAQATVRDALSPACERLVARVVSGEGDDQARDLVVETLADDAMPVAWRERLREQLAAASSAEIGHLTAQAIRSVQDGKDGEALEALERAERLAASLPIGAVADERREEFERRLWWGYTKVGMRRIEIRSFDGAVEPLFHALQLGGIDEERLGETRLALVRALDGVVDARAPAIQQLGGDTARIEIEKLTALVRSAIARGLGEDDLGEVLAKVTHLGQGLSQAS
jgi:hypothetical protein